MTDESSQISLSNGPPSSVLPPAPSGWVAELEAAGDDLGELKKVAGRHPEFLDVWARLAELTPDPVEAYAYARVGYHRGLDALRQAGWRGTGYVRWSDAPNRGFLRSLEALRERASQIGEAEEQERCRLFLRQLDGTLIPGRLPA
jgi:hypothetical protein